MAYAVLHLCDAFPSCRHTFIYAATLIWSRLPHVVIHSGVKQSILYSREHTVREALQHVKMWNAAYLQSDDLQEAMRAVLAKDTANFTKN
jgi:delta(3,5)-delta(2,4)-dienoyl-CoA isomerase